MEKTPYQQQNTTNNEPPKKVGLPSYVVLILVLLTAVLTFQITSVLHAGSNNSDTVPVDQLPGYFDTALIIDQYLREYSISDMDEEQVKHLLALAVIYASGDNYADYYTPEEYKEFQSTYQGSGVGVGIMITYTEDYYMEVLRAFDGAPASAAGIKGGDIIIAVDGMDVALIGYNAASDALKGEEGTSVTLTVKRGDQLLDFTVTRRPYVQQTVDGHMYKDGATDKKIGVVQIYSFTDATAEQFKSTVNTLIEQGAEGVVFDLRDNTGGTIDSVTEMLDFLLPEGPIVRITDKNGNEMERYVSDSSSIDLPMAVLTNKNTASAAELFTSALKDYGKAVSVGTNTYGKGVAQIIIPLNDGSAFKFSYCYYSPPFSENYNIVGIAPDIELPLPEGTRIPYLTDETDTQLARAVEYLLTGK